MSDELRNAVETDAYEYVDYDNTIDVSDAYADYKSAEDFD